MGEETKTSEAKEVKEYKLVTVPTGEALAIQTPTGDVITTEQAIVEILNITKDVAQSVA